MRALTLCACLLTVGLQAATVNLDVTSADVERALTIARSTDAERERFHAAYVSPLTTPLVERVEVVTEFRRIVMVAEERRSRGDRLFAYSATKAADAVREFKRRLSVVVRVRFHPQNAYVALPDLSVAADGMHDAFIGISHDPITALPPGRKGEFVPVLGAVVDAVFDAAMLGQGPREFVVRVDGREAARVPFMLGTIE